jgi:hypothetical protein
MTAVECLVEREWCGWCGGVVPGCVQELLDDVLVSVVWCES